MQGMESKGTAGEEEPHRGLKQVTNEPSACGPLDVKRYLKDDGRALILYARREHGDA
jgi:hypothetical protein